MLTVEKLGASSLIDLKKNSSEWEEAIIVFTEDSFNKLYSEESRSYKVNSDEYFFDSSKISNSLHADCLDGTDQGIRLDHYLEYWDIEKIITFKDVI